MGTDHHIFKAFCVPMAMLDGDHPDLALKLHWLMFPMLFCPVYEIGADGKMLSPTAAVKARVDRFLAGEWRSLWADALSITGQQNSRQPKVRTVEQDKASRALRAQHQALAAQLRDAHRTLVSPGLLSSRCPGAQAQLGNLFSYDPDTAEALPPEPPMPDDDTSPDPYRHNISTILVKQREGPEKEDPTLP
jgi:hypothetical protein